MLQIDIYILFAQIINFWILFFIFKKYIANAMNARIQERRRELEKLKKADEHYEQKMSLAQQQKKEILDTARETSSALMKESEVIIQQKVGTIIAKAKQEALAILESGKRELEKDRLSMLSQMKSHIIDVSLKLNEKMFGKWKTNKEFLEKELENL